MVSVERPGPNHTLDFSLRSGIRRIAPALSRAAYMLLRSVLRPQTALYPSLGGYRHVSKLFRPQRPEFGLAASIQRAIQDGEIHTGYNIFTSFHAESSTTHAGYPTRTNKSGRYLAHVLLHSLLRNNRAHAAASFAKLCMERGIRIRESTFLKVFAAISPPNDHQLNPLRTTARPHQVRPPSLTAAISLLAAARKSNHRQKPWMYDRVLGALLLQGEVLTAALLFATLVREWNARRRLKEVELMENGTLCLEESSEAATGGQVPDPNPSSVPKPAAVWMRQIIKELRFDRHVTLSTVDQHQAMRGLSALVPLLWDHVPFVPGRSLLIKTVAETPREFHTNAETHKQWQRRLEELCAQPTTMVPLDSASYHALLHYSLRQRRSLDLASQVLELLCRHHRPTSATYNILIREATKMNEADVSLQVRKRLSTRSTNVAVRACRTARNTSVPLTKIMEILAHFPIPTMDEYTAIAVMLADVSIGDIINASKFLFLLFPLLNRPAVGGKRDLGLGSAVRRARLLSPHFWATAVFIASKAHSLRLSMRIWRLVMRAEGAASAAGENTVRLYGVEAYTAHLGLFHKRLSEIERDVYHTIQPSSGTSDIDERVARLFTLYEWILRSLQAVLESLRDSTIRAKSPNALIMDELLVGVMFNLANLIFKLEKLLPHLARPALQRGNQFYGANSQLRVRWILEVLRRLLSSSSQHSPLPSAPPTGIVGETTAAYPEWWYDDKIPPRPSVDRRSMGR